MSRPDGYLQPCGMTVDRIIDEVARGFDVTVGDIIGPGRSRVVLMARACAMAVVREWTDLSYPRIGYFFNRHHTTVLYSIRKVMDDPELSEAVRLVVEELSPPPRLFAVDTSEAM